MPEFQLSVVIFIIGFIVTVATFVMVLKGNSYWKNRDPFDEGKE
jgi:hypothetical protein